MYSVYSCISLYHLFCAKNQPIVAIGLNDLSHLRNAFVTPSRRAWEGWKQPAEEKTTYGRNYSCQPCFNFNDGILDIME